METIPEIVDNLLDHFTGVWWSSPTTYPDLGPAFSTQMQAAREKQLRPDLDSLYHLIRQPAPAPSQVAATQDRLQGLVSSVFMNALSLEERHMDALIRYGFKEAIIEFGEMARKFDPQISEEDIYQAERNATSMNLMQILLGQPVRVTPSVFAFSMLYPYTDNYLDDPSISTEIKRSFNMRFRRRLEGEDVAPANAHEAKIIRLVGMIEGQYDRAAYPLVYESLLAIHTAQGKSLELVQSSASPYEVDVLRTCFEKGGTSTLADGYLVAGSLTPAQREFMFYYGCFTQLIDDLEDVHNDRKAGILTIYSLTGGRWPLDAITNRTFHFGSRAVEVMDYFDAPGIEPLKEVFAIALNPILVDSANGAASFYTREYRRWLQAHFPFRFSFLDKERRRFRRQRASLKLLLEGMLMYALARERR